jgi:hypothetical protein
MKKLFVTFMVALFATVVLGQTKKTEIGPNQLPDCVTKYITVNMAGYKIEKAVKIESNKVITYEVTVFKAEEKQILTFDADCTHVKKVNADQKKKPDDGTVNKKKEKKPVDPTAPEQTTAPAPKK